MKNSRFNLPSLVLATAALAMTSGAQAQSSPNSGMMGGFKMYTPGTAYVGFNAGRSYFNLGSGIGAFNTDDKGNAYNLYAGSYFTPYFGLELGYNDFGNITRGGGSSKAYGLNVSLVGRYPLTQAFSLTGRLGTTYGRTEVSASPLSGIRTGKDSGFGVSYGLGAEYAFTDSLSGVINYDEHDLKFIGTGRDNVGVASVGLKYRF